MFAGVAQPQPQRPQITHDCGKLHRKLQPAANDRTDCHQHREPRLRVPAPAPQQRRNHGDVPDDGGSVGKQKLAMAVENSQAPCRQHQHRRAGKQNLHQPDGEYPFVAMEPRRNEIDEPWRGKDTHDHQQCGDEKQERKDCLGELRGFFMTLLRIEPGIHGDEGRRKHAFAKEILQKIRDAKRGAKCVCGIGVAEVVRKDAIADQPHQTAKQNTGGYEKGMRLCGARLD